MNSAEKFRGSTNQRHGAGAVGTASASNVEDFVAAGGIEAFFAALTEGDPYVLNALFLNGGFVMRSAGSNLTTFTVDGMVQVTGDTINLPNGTTSVSIAATDGGSISALTGNTGLVTGPNPSCTFTVTSQNGTQTLNVTLTLNVALIAPNYATGPGMGSGPTVSGISNHEVGQAEALGDAMICAQPGDPVGTITYEWFVEDAVGSGTFTGQGPATPPVWTEDDLGKFFYVTGTSTNEAGSDSHSSDITGPVVPHT